MLFRYIKRARIFYIGAFHHLMNRGINGEAIFKAVKTGIQEKILFSTKLLTYPLECAIHENIERVFVDSGFGFPTF